MKMRFRLFAGLLAAIMIILAVPAYASAFSDVEADRWSADDVAYVVEKGYMNGTGNGNFSPPATVIPWNSQWNTTAKALLSP